MSLLFASWGVIAALVGFFLFATLVLFLSFFISRPDEEVVGGWPHSCGSSYQHYEDFPLCDMLNEGQTYQTIHARKTKKCHPDGGEYWLAWIMYKENDNCCGVEELIAFDQKPPEYFVYTNQGEILEVCGYVREKPTGSG